MSFKKNSILFTLVIVSFNCLAMDAQRVDDKARLRAAAHIGEIEKVRLFLSTGTEVNAADESGNTALILATQRGHEEVVKLLLLAGADVNVKN